MPHKYGVFQPSLKILSARWYKCLNIDALQLFRIYGLYRRSTAERQRHETRALEAVWVTVEATHVDSSCPVSGTEIRDLGVGKNTICGTHAMRAQPAHSPGAWSNVFALAEFTWRCGADFISMSSICIKHVPAAPRFASARTLILAIIKNWN